MPVDRTALEHLLDGRDALLLEVQRLNTAIEELDAVIGRLGGGERRADPASATQRSGAWGSSSDRTAGLATSRVGVTEPISPAGDAASRNRRAAVRTTATAGDNAEVDPPKSIRVHVLEMLAAQDREFGLGELIDGVHEAGIQAHDDAVRSITIKLMKDGKVERVGRGQYQLAGRGSRSSQSLDAEATRADTGTQVDTAGQEAPAASPAAEAPVAEAPVAEAPAAEQPVTEQPVTEQPVTEQPVTEQPVAEQPVAEQPVAEQPVADQPAATQPVAEKPEEPPAQPSAAHQDTAPRSGYTPPLNLGQPWNR